MLNLRLYILAIYQMFCNQNEFFWVIMKYLQNFQMDVPTLLLDKTWTSNPVTEFEEPIDCEIFDQV